MEVLDKVRIEVDVSPTAITIFECRPPWDSPGRAVNWTRFPVARLRRRRDGVWTLYWRDRNLKFHRYEEVSPTSSIDVLLDEIDRDPTAIFWG